jgi:hypothetical protein
VRKRQQLTRRSTMPRHRTTDTVRSNNSLRSARGSVVFQHTRTTHLNSAANGQKRSVVVQSTAAQQKTPPRRATLLSRPPTTAVFCHSSPVAATAAAPSSNTTNVARSGVPCCLRVPYASGTTLLSCTVSPRSAKIFSPLRESGAVCVCVCVCVKKMAVRLSSAQSTDRHVFYACAASWATIQSRHPIGVMARLGHAAPHRSMAGQADTWEGQLSGDRGEGLTLGAP